DWGLGGFAPGTAYRDETTPVQDIEVDLADYARSQNASAEVVTAAEAVESAIQGKIPRGRHRATFCMALELLESGGQALPTVVSRFGFPKKPTSWETFDAQMESRLRQVLADYKIGTQQASATASGAPATSSVAGSASAPATPVVSAPPVAPMSLPKNYDYSGALVAAPSPPAKAKTTGLIAKPPKKVDHVKKATKDDAVGKLGEEFAFQFERWRLRNHPDLLGKIEHVSKTDDTLGYDILSFETDGTPRYVEVKSTVGPIETRFFISANEVACAQAKGATYLILRVGDLPDHPKCCEIRHPFDDTVELLPATYAVTFKPSSAPD
ncbi:MAG: DUF3883 domain-containing protein, partial [Caulobacterales bacterium]|nr:DUF3883 domain-containing protein [Caulobacterales bacterium]